jgi:hypothetical protein
MSRVPIKAAALGLVCALVLGGAAVAAGLRPTLGKPNHKPVHVGAIVLKLADAAPKARKYGVFITINKMRRLDKHGNLSSSPCHSDSGCTFVQAKPWAHHPGMWVYSPPNYGFPGFWATTPGKYYWQAEHTDCNMPGCEATSKIGWFQVVP